MKAILTETVEETVNETVEEVIERPYTLRTLKDNDLWAVLDIIAKVFPDDLANVFGKLITKEKTLTEIGAVASVQLVIAVIKNMNTVHDEVYSFLSAVSGIPANEIEEMPFGTSPMMIWDIATDVKNASFFKVVSKFAQ